MIAWKLPLSRLGALLFFSLGAVTCAGCGQRMTAGPARSVMPPGSYEVGRSPYAVRLADLDGDGMLDAVTGNLIGHSITVLSGGAPGHPAHRLDRAAGGIVPAVAVGDLDGDGLQDVAAAVRSRGGHVALFRGVRSDVLGPLERLPVRGIPNDIAAGDLDGDGQTELVVAIHGGGLLEIHPGPPGAAPRIQRLPLENCRGSWNYGPDGVVVEDLDGDGRAEIAVACLDTYSIVVLEHEGDTWKPRPVAQMRAAAHAHMELQPLQDFGSLPYPDCPLRKVRALDLDADGHMDLAAISDCGSLLLAFGGATGFTMSVIDAPGIEGANDLALGDIDGDGLAEILITTGHERTLLVVDSPDFRGHDVQVHRRGELPVTPESLVLAHVDGDAHLDLVLAAEHASAVQFLRGDGKGFFFPFPAAAGRRHPQTAAR